MQEDCRYTEELARKGSSHREAQALGVRTIVRTIICLFGGASFHHYPALGRIVGEQLPGEWAAKRRLDPLEYELHAVPHRSVNWRYGQVSERRGISGHDQKL